MSELIVIAADTHEAAFGLRAKIAGMAREFSVETQDIVVIVRDRDGAVRLHPMNNARAMQAIGGTVWGLGLGAIFLMPLVGAAVGAAAGALAGRALNVGIDNGFLDLLGQDLPPETAAVALLARRVEPDRLAALVETHGGTILYAALSDDVADAMPAATDAGTPTKGRVHVAGYRDQPVL